MAYANPPGKVVPKKDENVVEPIKRIEELTAKLTELMEKKDDLNSKGLHLDSDEPIAELNTKFRAALKTGDEPAMFAMGDEIGKYHASYTAESEKQKRIEQLRDSAVREIPAPLKSDVERLGTEFTDLVNKLDSYRVDFEEAAQKLSKELKPQIDEINKLGSSITIDRDAIEKEVDAAHKNIKDRVETTIEANTAKAELSAQIKGMEDDLKAKEAALEEKKGAAKRAEESHDEAFKAYDAERKAKGFSEPAIERESKKPDAKIDSTMLDAVKLYRAVDEREAAARNAGKEMEAAEEQYYLTQQRNKKIGELDAQLKETQGGLDAYLSEKGKEFDASIDKLGKLASRMHVAVNDERNRVDLLLESVMPIQDDAAKCKTIGVPISDETNRALTEMMVAPTIVPDEYIPQKTGDIKAGKRAPIIARLREAEGAVEEAKKGMPVVLPEDLKNNEPPPPPPPITKPAEAAPVIAPPPPAPDEVKKEQPPPPPVPITVQPPALTQEQLAEAAHGAYAKICMAMAAEPRATLVKTLDELKAGNAITAEELAAIRLVSPTMAKVKKEGECIKFLAADDTLLGTLDYEGNPLTGKKQPYKPLAELETALFAIESTVGEKPFSRGTILRDEYFKLKNKLVEANNLLEKNLDEMTWSDIRKIDKAIEAYDYRRAEYPKLKDALRIIEPGMVISPGPLRNTLEDVGKAILATDDLEKLYLHIEALDKMRGGPYTPASTIQSVLERRNIGTRKKFGVVLKAKSTLNEMKVDEAKAIAKAADKFNAGMSTRKFVRLAKAVRDNPHGREAAKEYMEGCRLSFIVPLLPFAGELYIVPSPKTEVKHFVWEHDNAHPDAPITKPQLAEISRIGRLIDDINLGRAWTRKNVLLERTAFDILKKLENADRPVNEVLTKYVESKRNGARDNISKQVKDAETLNRLIKDKPLKLAENKLARKFSRLVDDIEYYRGWTRSTVFMKDGEWLYAQLGEIDRAAHDVVDQYIDDTDKARVKKRLGWESGQLAPRPVRDGPVTIKDQAAAEAHIGNGNAAYNYSSISSALEHYEKAIEKNPNSSLAWHNKHNALLLLGRKWDSLDALDTAVELEYWEDGLSKISRSIRRGVEGLRNDSILLRDSIEGSTLADAKKSALSTQREEIHEALSTMMGKRDDAAKTMGEAKLKELSTRELPALRTRFENLKMDFQSAVGELAADEEGEGGVASEGTTEAIKTQLKAAQDSVKLLRDDIKSAKDADDIMDSDAAGLMDELEPHAKRLGAIGKSQFWRLSEEKCQEIITELAAMGKSIAELREDYDDMLFPPEQEEEAGTVPPPPPTTIAPALKEKVIETEKECPTCGAKLSGTKSQIDGLAAWSCDDCGEQLNDLAQADAVNAAKTAAPSPPPPPEVLLQQPPPPPPPPPVTMPTPQPAAVVAKVGEPEPDLLELMSDKINPLIERRSSLVTAISDAELTGEITAGQAAELRGRTNSLEKPLEDMKAMAIDGKNLRIISEADVPTMDRKIAAIEKDLETAKAERAPASPAAPAAVAPPVARVAVTPAVAAEITVPKLGAKIDELGTDITAKLDDPNFVDKLSTLVAISKERKNLYRMVKEGMPADELKKAEEKYQKLRSKLDELAK